MALRLLSVSFGHSGLSGTSLALFRGEHPARGAVFVFLQRRVRLLLLELGNLLLVSVGERNLPLNLVILNRDLAVVGVLQLVDRLGQLLVL